MANGSFVYTSWNVKNISDRLLESVATRSQTSSRKRNRSGELLSNNTELAQLHSQILTELKSDVVAIMEGVKSKPSSERVAKRFKVLLNAMQSNSPNQKIYSERVSNLSGHRRADRYIIISSDSVEINPGSRQAVYYPTYNPNSDLHNWVDRMPGRFTVRVKSSRKDVSCFVWHAPQPANTQGPKTIARLANYIKECETDTSIPTQYLIVSGDYNINTANTNKFSALLPSSGNLLTALNSFFSGHKTTLRKSVSSKIRKNKTVFDSLTEAISDVVRYDDALKSAYDDIYISNSLTQKSVIRLNLVQWAIKYIKDKNQITSARLTRSVASSSMVLGNEISDHIPLSIEVEIP